MLTNKRNWLRVRPLVGVVGLIILVLSVFTGHVFAGTYGEDGYSSCSYQQDCTQTSGDTTSTLASGLQVFVNLVDGQVIPRNGYTIVITPLNGATTDAAIKQVEIYLDGVLVATVQPEITGTAQWAWQPKDLPAKQIKLVVTDTAGSTITNVFNVTIESVTATQPNNPDDTHTATAEKNTGIGAVIQRVYDTTKRFVAKLPKRVVYGFPYALFLLLGVNVAVLLWQAAKELREYHIWLGLVGRERLRAEEKRTLLQLIAHYLRTPLTVLKGGIDILTPADGTAGTGLGNVTKRLQDEIEQLLARTAQVVSGSANVGTDGGLVTFGSMLRRPGLVLPLVLVAAIVLPFDHLVNAAGTLNISQVNIAMQVIVFGLLAVLTYVVYRRVLLSHRNAAEAQRVYEQEQALRRASDGLIDGVAHTLQADIVELDRMAAQLPAASDAAEYIVDSTQRFKELATKMTVAEQLSHAQAGDTFTSVALDDLLNETLKKLDAEAVKHEVSIERPGPLDFAVRSAELADYVLETVLDNAIAYSPKGGVVRIQAAKDSARTTITVIDSGVGIPSEKQLLLFEPFSRIETAEDFTHQGMGFSLYLDRAIMQYLGGDIAVQSDAGHGTTVTLTFPQKNVQAA
jgi:signal transduction histidine kinase